MLKGLNLNEVKEYVSKKDTTDNPTKFLIGVLRHEDKLDIFGSAMNEKGEVNVQKIIKENLYRVLIKGIKGIKNFDGKDYDAMTIDLVDKIEFEVLTELLEAVLNYNFPSENERKN